LAVGGYVAPGGPKRGVGLLGGGKGDCVGSKVVFFLPLGGIARGW
jgi:hypothetical protein